MTTYNGTSAGEYLPPNTLVTLTFSERNSLEYVGWFNSQFSALMSTAIPRMTTQAGVVATTPSDAVAGDRAATIDAVVKAGRTAAETVNAINAVLPTGVGLDSITVQRRAVDLNPADGTNYSTTSAAAAQARSDATAAAAAEQEKGSLLKQLEKFFSELGTTVKYVLIVAVLFFVWVKAKE